MKIQIRTLEPHLICLDCHGVISQRQSGDTDDPMHVLGTWCGKVLLNIGQTEFIDSSGIAWLLYWNRQIQKAGGVFALCSVPPRVNDVLNLCQLHQILAIYDDEPSARADLSAPGPQDRPQNSSTDRA